MWLLLALATTLLKANGGWRGPESKLAGRRSVCANFHRRVRLRSGARGFGEKGSGSYDYEQPQLKPRELKKAREAALRVERTKQRDEWREQTRGKYLTELPLGKSFRLVVDGNNVMGVSKGITKADLMRKFAKAVESDLRFSSVESILIFDSRGRPSLENKGKLEVFFCGKGTQADDVIIEVLMEQPVRLEDGRREASASESMVSGTSIVVTSDLELGARCVSKGAFLMRRDDFYRHIAPEEHSADLDLV
ncbi:hypothetical protein AAMO2058_000438800 [Amorphochlora amoebiformis]